MTITEKQELLAEAERRFPSGCSYKARNGTGEICQFINENVEYTEAYWHFTDSIALKPGAGLVYNAGKWAEIVNYPKGYKKSNKGKMFIF